MIIPLRAETPNYSGATTLGHFPWVTLGLIAVNVVVFVFSAFGDEESIEPYLLEYGNGLHPLQWLTSAFLHADLMHLLGNMIFLWVFGLVVEGRLGWWKFLAVYLFLAAAQGALEQSVLYWIEYGYALGASGNIYGLLAMALIFAPETEIVFLWNFFLRFGTFPVAILWVALWYIGLDLVLALSDGFELSTEMLHSTGAVVGFAVGLAMLKLNWVECEGWDLLTVMTGGHLRKDRGRSRAKVVSKHERSAPAADGESEAERLIRARQDLRLAVAQRNAVRALSIYATRDPGKWMLPEIELRKFIDLVCTQNRYEEAVPLLESYLARFAEKAAPARLKLAQILIEKQQRPVYSLRILEKVDRGALSEQHARLAKAIAKKAQQMIDDGVLELEIGPSP